MKRYSWTPQTMTVATIGGAYVTYADHLKAMAELEERLKPAMAKTCQSDARVGKSFEVCELCNGAGRFSVEALNGSEVSWACFCTPVTIHRGEV